MDAPMLTRQRASVVAASVSITMAGGVLDAWVYLAHGHVFATAQTGNIVLMTISVANGDLAQAVRHLASLTAFVAGVFMSRQAGSVLKRRKLASREIRLGLECVLLIALGLTARDLSNQAVIACVGFIAGLQITSLSHIGAWSFNTGMTTGNLRGAISAFSRASSGAREEWAHALMLTALCVAFGIGALAGAWLTPRLGELTLLPMAALVAVTIAVAPRRLDPIPAWDELH